MVDIEFLSEPNRRLGRVPLVQPFTLREAPTFLSILEETNHWITNVLIPHVDSTFGNLVVEWDGNATELSEAWKALSDDLKADVGQAVTDITDQVDGARDAMVEAKAAAALAEKFSNQMVAFQDSTVSALVSMGGGMTNTALKAFFDGLGEDLRERVTSLEALPAKLESVEKGLGERVTSLEALPAKLESVEKGVSDVSSSLANIDSVTVKKKDVHFNVMDYGATGNGVKDDAPAIQAAIDASIGTGVPVYVPAGNYRVDAPLLFRGNGISFRASSEATISKYHDTAMTLNGNVGQTGKGFDDIDLEGGVWDLRGHTNKTYGGAVSFGKGVNLRVAKMTILNNFQNHNIEIAGCENVLIEDIDHQGVYFGDSDHYYVEAIQLEHMSAAGFPRFAIDDKTPCVNVTIRRNRQIAPVGRQSAWPCAIGGHSAAPVGAKDIRRIVIEDVNFGVCTYAVVRPRDWVDVQLIRVEGTAPNAAFLECSIDRPYSLSMVDCKFTGTTRALWAIRARNLSISHCELTAPNGSLLEGCSEVTISERSSLTATTGDGLAVQNNAADTGRGNENITDSNSTVVDGRQGIQLYSNANSTVRRVKILGNDISGGSGAAINIAGAGAVSINGNSIKTFGGAEVIRDSSGNGVSIVGNTYPHPATLTNGAAPRYQIVGNVSAN